jgi:hypothetical protein
MTDIDVGTVVTTLLTLYALGIGAFLISENRAPKATLAWMLAFILAPGLGVLIYFLFGRDGRAFSKQSKLLKQDLAETARPVLTPILSRQDAEITRLERDNPNRRRLMRLVRRNSSSVLTTVTESRSSRTQRVLRQPDQRHGSCAPLHPSSVLHLERRRVHGTGEGNPDSEGASRSRGAPAL